MISDYRGKDLFFSAENIRIVQNGLKAGVYNASNGNFRIGDQNEDTLKIIIITIVNILSTYS